MHCNDQVHKSQRPRVIIQFVSKGAPPTIKTSHTTQLPVALSSTLPNSTTRFNGQGHVPILFCGGTLCLELVHRTVWPMRNQHGTNDTLLTYVIYLPIASVRRPSVPYLCLQKIRALRLRQSPWLFGQRQQQ